MRIAVISDVHGNLAALECVLADAKARTAPDVMINLGDCVTSPLWPLETWQLFQSLGLPTVRGNHDRWLTEMPDDETAPSVLFAHRSLSGQDRAALHALPTEIRMGDDILAVHGTRASDTSYLLEDKVEDRLRRSTPADIATRLGGESASLVLCGHSHTQHMALVPGNRLVVNPGSVGCPRYADGEPDKAEASTPHARYAIATRGKRGWSVELFALEYDFDAVAQQARANGRGDWAAAFLRGLT